MKFKLVQLKLFVATVVFPTLFIFLFGRTSFQKEFPMLMGIRFVDLLRLLELKGRSQLAMCSAKQFEKQMMDRGAVQTARKTRRLRKKEKEKFNEITTLLKLKLGSEKSSQVVDVGEESLKHCINGAGKTNAPRSTISSMEQLVARMMLRRRELARPISKTNLPSAKLSSWSHSHRRSPLSNP